MNINNLETATLGFFPTPIVELANLSDYLQGPRIYMKRDDLTGLALGGNKVRKLEYILGDAVSQGFDTVITAGAAQSNHCRQTAAAAAYLGIDCHLVLGGQAPEQLQGNLLLDNLFGCTIHWAGDNRKGEDIPAIVDQLKVAGKKPYAVPYGGSNELGAIAFIKAFEEMDKQVDGEAFSHIVFASSSGGTQAGLMIGKKQHNRPTQLIGINIDKDEIGDLVFDQHILELANRTAKIIGMTYQFNREDLCLNADYVGDGYGVVGPLETEAMGLVAAKEGILLDPVYTGRAMGGLIDLIRTGAIDKQAKVLFWHTGGAPALFAYADKIK